MEPKLTLQALYESFARHPEGQWIMQPPNAKLLYKFVMEHDITRVLDLGTGIGVSASVAALALKDKGVDFHVDSIEQNPKCVNLAKKLIPPDLLEHITIYNIPATTWTHESIPHQTFSVYESLPERDYDLIVNDGPSPMLLGGHYVDLNNGSITKLLLEGTLKPGTFIAFDGRIQALKTLERYYGENFLLVQPGGNSDFNVIEKKEGDVVFHDDKLEQMTAVGYFDDTVPTPPETKI